MYTAPRWSFSKGAPIATSLNPSRLRSDTAATAVPKRAPHGSFLFPQLSEWAVQQDWLTGFKVNWCSNWPSWLWRRGETAGWFPSGVSRRQKLYLLESVDVDLSLLVSLCAHEHRRSDQQEVCEGIAVDIQRLQHAAEVGADLHGGQSFATGMLS